MYKYFKGEYKTIQEVKQEYRKLAFQYHPDRLNGDVQIMQEVNNEYDVIIKEVASKQDKEVKINDTLENNFKSIIMELAKLPDDVTVAIVGWYVWIDGNTKPHKELLAKLGCHWSSNQKKWYYNGIKHKTRACSKKSWSEITTYFGYVEIEKIKQEKQELKQLQTA